MSDDGKAANVATSQDAAMQTTEVERDLSLNPAPDQSAAMAGDLGSQETSATAGSGVVELVERWWAEHFPGSPVGERTEAWNVAHAAKEDLKQRLAAFFDGAR